MEGDGRRPGAEDRPAASGIHGRRAARLRADGAALALVEEILNGFELFNRGEFATALEGFDPEVEWIVLDMLPERGPFLGREGVKRFWELWSETFSLFHIEVKDVTSAGEHAIVTMRVRGTGRDSGAQVITPWFPQAWTAREGKFVRVEMFNTREDALGSVGLPAGTPAVGVTQRRSEPEAP